MQRATIMTSSPMRIVAIREPGGPDVLQMRSADMPVPRAGEILIEVKAAGVNRPDVAQRMGRYPVPADANPVPGLEVAGVVRAVGAGVTTFAVGQRVFALTHGGGYATYCAVDAGQALAMLPEMSFIEAAALPEVAFTVEFNMMMRAGLKSGETVLVHGGSSGIGSHAIQRAKAAGATVLTTAGSDEKCDFCRSLGADLAVNYKTADWQPAVMGFTAQRGVDVVLDMVAGGYLQKNLECLALDGRYALISLQGGRKMEVDVEPILRRRLTLTGSTLRPLPASRKALIACEVAEKVLPLIAAKKIVPHVFRTFPLAQASEAHRLMETGTHLGKIVLDVDGTG
jgi:putative PIG3 family NAD(P)H quinone oxidoreductase